MGHPLERGQQLSERYLKFQSAVLKKHLQDWQEITQDPVTLQTVQGVRIPLKYSSPLRYPLEHELTSRDVDPVVDTAIKELLKLKAIQEVQRETPVFISKVFTVPKLERGKKYGKRFILLILVRGQLMTYLLMLMARPTTTNLK